MNGPWLWSYTALWIVNVLLVLGFLALARQIGLLHRRLPAVGARGSMHGPSIGETAPPLLEKNLKGEEMTLASDRGKKTVLVFFSSDCGPCNELAPALRSVAKSEVRRTETILVSLDDVVNAQMFVDRYSLSSIPVVVSPRVADAYGVSTTPYAIAIDQLGVVRAKGIVNHIEHLESLFNQLERPIEPILGEVTKALDHQSNMDGTKFLDRSLGHEPR